jgi:hypothetical protein
VLQAVLPLWTQGGGMCRVPWEPGTKQVGPISSVVSLIRIDARSMKGSSGMPLRSGKGDGGCGAS